MKNRRGTKIRFKPDPQDLRQGRGFKPARLFRMARSKAYLFGGVEIRWSCAKAALGGDNETPESAVLHFPGGLKDFLADRIDGQETVTNDVFAGQIEKNRGPWLGRMGDRLGRGRRRLPQFLLQHRADPRWRHA